MEKKNAQALADDFIVFFFWGGGGGGVWYKMLESLLENMEFCWIFTCVQVSTRHV